MDEWVTANIPAVSVENAGAVEGCDQGWRVPIGEKLQFNIDVSWLEDYGMTGMCGVCRDDQGVMVAVFSKCIPSYIEPRLAEAMCIREVLCWAKELKLSDMVVASDACYL